MYCTKLTPPPFRYSVRVSTFTPIFFSEIFFILPPPPPPARLWWTAALSVTRHKCRRQPWPPWLMDCPKPTLPRPCLLLSKPVLRWDKKDERGTPLMLLRCVGGGLNPNEKEIRKIICIFSWAQGFLLKQSTPGYILCLVLVAAYTSFYATLAVFFPIREACGKVRGNAVSREGSGEKSPTFGTRNPNSFWWAHDEFQMWFEFWCVWANLSVRSEGVTAVLSAQFAAF